MPKKNDAITLRITRRELATILAALPPALGPVVLTGRKEKP